MTVRDLRSTARSHGAHVSLHTGIGRRIYVVRAPAGSVWIATGAHELTVRWIAHAMRSIVTRGRDEAIRDARRRMALGLEPCQDDACNDCRPGTRHWHWACKSCDATGPEEVYRSNAEAGAADHLRRARCSGSVTVEGGKR